MHDPEPQPILARPVVPFPPRPPHAPGGEGLPPTIPPTARPVEALPYAPATVKPAPVVYPDCDLTRVAAGLDLLLAFAAFVGGELALGALVFHLVEAYPSLGIFWSNLIMGVFSLLLVGLILLIRNQGPSSIGLNRAHIGKVAAGVLAALPCCYAAICSTGIAYTIIRTQGGVDPIQIIEEKKQFFDQLPEISLFSSTLFALFVGVHEEVLFRGFVLSRLCALLKSKPAAILASSVLFGGLHLGQGPAAVFQITALGLVLAVVVTMTRSLWPAILTHALFDALQFALIPLVAELYEDYAEELSTAPAG